MLYMGLSAATSDSVVLPSDTGQSGRQLAPRGSLADWPFTARCCINSTVFLGFCCVLALACCEVGPLYESEIPEDEIGIFRTARSILILPWSLMALFHARERCFSIPRSKALVISGVALAEFSIAITYYTMLSRGNGVAFLNQRAFDLRPIYTVRWGGWTLAAPTLLFMNLYPILDHCRPLEVAIRMFPQLAVTAAYCVACWLGSILCDPVIGWGLIVLGCVAYIFQVIDEVVLVSEHLLTSTRPVVKGYSIILTQCMFVFYTAVFMMGMFGRSSSYACQRFYTVSDTALKCTMASLHMACWWLDEHLKLD